ncbi:Hypothetical predicted protein [Pelobates cultripes]|uniref:Uncharacterized protein n=1 Tax=Pelobates cultripes TaxID=61616 RepID=A0AAD1W005_PELCU|nr:Hypothetical predicted protein [Pelobates cultripes]
MGRTKKSCPQQPLRNSQTPFRAGPMEQFLTTLAELAGTAAAHHVEMSSEPDSPGPSEISEAASPYPMSQLRADLRAISQAMFTKTDAGALEASLKGTIWAELAAIRQVIIALQDRVTTLEAVATTSTQQHQAAELAATRQGNMLLDVRRQVEDLDNRGKRCNIRIQGLPGSMQGEPLEAMLQTLFNFILGNEDPETFQLGHVHRAFRQTRSDGTPQDIVCCLHSF